MRFQYPFDKQREIDRFIEERYPDLRGEPYHIYRLGLPSLEKKLGRGFGGTIVTSLDTWAEELRIHRNTIKAGLERLSAMYLIELKIGESRKGNGTSVRRRTIDEIKAHVPKDILNQYVDVDSQKLAEILQSKGIFWGDTKTCPEFRVKRTGRIVTANPCLHTVPESKRVKTLLNGLKQGEILINSDYAQAEPTILLHVLKQRSLLSKDFEIGTMYEDLAGFMETTRPFAKDALLGRLYSSYSHIYVPAQWNLPSDHKVAAFLMAVDKYRHILWDEGAASDGSRRHVYTITGRKIEATLGDRVHHGQLLSWKIQGSIADIMNKVVLRLLELESQGKLRYLLSVYDCCYVAVARHEDQYVAEEVMKTEADKIGIRIGIKTCTKTPKKVIGGNMVQICTQ